MWEPDARPVKSTTCPPGVELRGFTPSCEPTVPSHLCFAHVFENAHHDLLCARGADSPSGLCLAPQVISNHIVAYPRLGFVNQALTGQVQRGGSCASRWISNRQGQSGGGRQALGAESGVEYLVEAFGCELSLAGAHDAQDEPGLMKKPEKRELSQQVRGAAEEKNVEQRG